MATSALRSSVVGGARRPRWRCRRWRRPPRRARRARPGAELVEQPLGDRHGLRAVGEPSSRTANSSPPRRATGVLRAHAAREAARERDEQLVAVRVAEPVVDRLEVVEVDEEHGDVAGRRARSDERVARRSRNSTRLARPVSGSCRARCTASAWLRALVSASDACSANARSTSRSDSAYGRPSARCATSRAPPSGSSCSTTDSTAGDRRARPRRREPVVEAHAGGLRAEQLGRTAGDRADRVREVAAVHDRALDLREPLEQRLSLTLVFEYGERAQGEGQHARHRPQQRHLLARELLLRVARDQQHSGVSSAAARHSHGPTPGTSIAPPLRPPRRAPACGTSSAKPIDARRRHR